MTSTPNDKTGNADTATDNVNHPPHYNFESFEVIDVIVESLGIEGARSYCQGNIIKYQTRYRFKNGDEDLHKRHWYSTMDELLSTCDSVENYYSRKKLMFKKETAMDNYNIITEDDYLTFDGPKFSCLYFKKDNVFVANQTRGMNFSTDELKDLFNHTNSSEGEYGVYFKTNQEFFKGYAAPQAIHIAVCDMLSSEFFLSLHTDVNHEAEQSEEA